MNSVEDAMQQIKRGADEILVESELEEKLKRKKPLNIKAGFDPTAPDLHLGHFIRNYAFGKPVDEILPRLPRAFRIVKASD